MVNKILNFFFRIFRVLKVLKVRLWPFLQKEQKCVGTKGNCWFNPLIIRDEDFVRIKNVQFLKYFIQLLRYSYSNLKWNFRFSPKTFHSPLPSPMWLMCMISPRSVMGSQPCGSRNVCNVSMRSANYILRFFTSHDCD
jgi:hypothetical protein